MRDRVIIVLDDDPTGTQTVHGTPIYTTWGKSAIQAGFMEVGKLFFILTNSRSFSEEQTMLVHREIATTIAMVAAEQDKKYLIVCRGDSTLRGHYLLELDTMANALTEVTGNEIDGEIICPCFFEGGRITRDGVHYVREDNLEIPVAETEFAKDKTFGYTHSHLGAYVQEKTSGRIRKEDCSYIELEDLEKNREELILDILLNASKRKIILVNAENYIQLDRFCRILERAMKLGKTMIVRSAASFVKSIGEIPDRPFLTAQEINSPFAKQGGLIVVGSHVNKTTRQLECLKASNLPVRYIEFQAGRVLEEGGLEQEARRCLEITERSISAGQHVVIYTSRQVLEPVGLDKETVLQLSVKISQALTGIVGNLMETPAFLIAKGGITSSDVATKALGIKRGVVMGQIKSGIPVWRTGNESRFPGLAYIIFPGNVGTETDLRDIVEELSEKSR